MGFWVGVCSLGKYEDSSLRSKRRATIATAAHANPVACPLPDIVSSASRLRSTLMHEWIALNGRGAVDVLDEQDLIADLVIEELVNGASGEEETEAAGW